MATSGAIRLQQFKERLGIEWQDHQVEAFEGEAATEFARLKSCLYFRTGAGKTYTSLGLLAQAGAVEALVVAPPATHAQWQQHAMAAGISITTISHAKYRMPDFKASKTMPVIVDEFHLLGGHDGKGWKRFRLHARGIAAPLVILSATPNYNDAERCYCIEHILNPVATKGGYLQWLYQNCKTVMNPYGSTPEVTGFWAFPDAPSYLAAIPHVYYLEDPWVDFPIADLNVDIGLPWEFEDLGVSRRDGRIMASQIEARHAGKRLHYLREDGLLKTAVYDEMSYLAGNASTPLLVFSDSSRIAEGAYRKAVKMGARALLITGKSTTTEKVAAADMFRSGQHDVLIATATLATGVDGLDKMCDHLCILDDTNDDALRRQLIGRILPRGLDADVSKKFVYRINVF